MGQNWQLVVSVTHTACRSHQITETKEINQTSENQYADDNVQQIAFAFFLLCHCQNYLSWLTKKVFY
jgi:hypothetical protein